MTTSFLKPALTRRQALRLAAHASTAAMLGVSALASISAATAAATTVTVPITEYAFTPAELTVAPGTTVTWTNGDEVPHNIVAEDKSFHSSALDTEESFSFTFQTPGEYKYFCTFHPHMVGMIIVK